MSPPGQAIQSCKCSQAACPPTLRPESVHRGLHERPGCHPLIMKKTSLQALRFPAPRMLHVSSFFYYPYANKIVLVYKNLHSWVILDKGKCWYINIPAPCFALIWVMICYDLLSRAKTELPNPACSRNSSKVTPRAS